MIYDIMLHMTSHIPTTFPVPQDPRKGLPNNAVCVYKGVIFEVWQWEQKMFDGRTEIFERAWRAPSALVIATVGDKIVIEEQSQPDHADYLSLPSGRVEEGEGIIDGAKRELLEETGYTSPEWSALMEYQAGGKTLYDIGYYVARNCVRTQEPELDGGELITLQFLDFDEFIMLHENEKFLTYPEFIRMLFVASKNKAEREKLRRAIFGE